MRVTHTVSIDVTVKFAVDLYKSSQTKYKLTKIVNNPDPEALGAEEMYFFALETSHDKKTRKSIEFAFKTLKKAKAVRKLFTEK